MTGVHLNKLPAGAIIHRRWEIHSKLGSGGYGIVFKATNPTRKLTVALKLGRLGVDGTTFALKMEAEVLRRLQGLPHTCRFYGFGETGNFAYVAMELLGPSLAELQRNRKRLGVSTGIRVGRQCLAAIQAVHRIGFLHRDIKPANFAVGRGSRNRQVFIVDFGLARCYVKPDLSGLRSPRRYGRFLGTDDYASVRAHRRQELDRVDDLWGFLYLLVEMVSGCLPWRTVADRQAVGWMKAEITPSKLCAECPPEFLRLYSYLKRLGWNAEPNYSILDSLLVEVQRRRHIDDSDPFVWEADDITTDNNTEDHDNWMTMEDTG